ncbi:unnamed protein product [Danaus chrysippus]|uniref:(African queen) hypothetical protein n=1 Tax=Danaus chrysippus TaxID=151541 RepID=A0A8J2W7C7_9NEOP|nr:unnamed protein product [Danaus chrysippus]
MSNQRQILRWLEEVSDEEQDVAGSDSEDKTENDAAIDSAHDSESVIEESGDIQNIPEPSEAALVIDHQKRRIQQRATTKKRLCEIHNVDETVQRTTAKRGRCPSCPRKNDKKLPTKCFKCHKFICQQHSRVYCVGCRTEESAEETD